MINKFSNSIIFISYLYTLGQKPFNPILGETYETIRGDRGFKFIAEQV